MKSLEKGVLAGLVKMLENKKYPVADWKREVDLMNVEVVEDEE